MPYRAYIAGLIDGEGTIRVQFMKSRGPAQYVPMLRITSVNKEVLDYVTQYYGGWIRSYQPKASNGSENCRIAYDWTLQGRTQVLRTILDLQPYCIIKREHIRLMIKFLQEGEMSTPPAPVSQTEIGRRRTIFEQFKVLNQRGVAHVTRS